MREKKEEKNGVSHNPAELEGIKKKAQEYDALWDKYLRLCAEFDNARKRWEKERIDLVKFGSVSLIRELVVILDELEHALKAIEEHSDNKEIAQGVKMIYNNLLSLLKKEGLQIIGTGGKKFDPHVHEIVGQREVDETQEHMVIEEVQRGYLLVEKVLRTSKVIVGVKRKAEDTPMQTSEQGSHPHTSVETGISEEQEEQKEEEKIEGNTEGLEFRSASRSI